MRHVPARAWYNLGIAYQRSSLNSQALAAYQQAARMPDSDSRMQQTARDMKKYMDGLKEVQRWWGQAPVTNSALMIPMLETNR